MHIHDSELKMYTIGLPIVTLIYRSYCDIYKWTQEHSGERTPIYCRVGKNSTWGQGPGTRGPAGIQLFLEFYTFRNTL